VYGNNNIKSSEFLYYPGCVFSKGHFKEKYAIQYQTDGIKKQSEIFYDEQRKIIRKVLYGDDGLTIVGDEAL
jgi:hypothetical protein